MGDDGGTVGDVLGGGYEAKNGVLGGKFERKCGVLKGTDGVLTAFIGARGNSLVLEGKDVPEGIGGARRCMYVMLGGKDVIDDATRG